MSAAAAEKRRQLRRQRILANSGNRLDVVLGKVDLKDVEKVEPEEEGFLPAPPNIQAHAEQDYPEDPPLERLVRDQAPDPPLETLSRGSTQAHFEAAPAPPAAAVPFWKDSLPWILLGLLGPTLTRLVTPHLLVILLLTSLTVILYGAGLAPRAGSAGSYVAIALQLCGLKPGSVRKILLTWTILSELSRHLGLFMFTFVVSSAVSLNLPPNDIMEKINSEPS